MDSSIYRNLHPGIIVDHLEAYHFESHRAYYELHTAVHFYEKYRKFEYILTHQLDAFVFSDQLEFWCKQEYDFIGAPWFENFGRAGNKKLWAVGNSGFCLRRVESFIRALEELPKDFKTGPDDFFFGVKAPELYDWFKVPTPLMAVPFSFEVLPAYLFNLNGGELPFGCHAWPKIGVNFWKPIIESYGFSL